MPRKLLNLVGNIGIRSIGNNQNAGLVLKSIVIQSMRRFCISATSAFVYGQDGKVVLNGGEDLLLRAHG